jgi:hypothetical protein
VRAARGAGGSWRKRLICGRREPRERLADEPRDVHLGDADPTDLCLREVFLKAQSKDEAFALVERRRELFDGRGVVDSVKARIGDAYRRRSSGRVRRGRCLGDRGGRRRGGPRRPCVPPGPARSSRLGLWPSVTAWSGPTLHWCPREAGTSSPLKACSRPVVPDLNPLAGVRSLVASGRTNDRATRPHRGLALRRVRGCL